MLGAMMPTPADVGLNPDDKVERLTFPLMSMGIYVSNCVHLL